MNDDPVLLFEPMVILPSQTRVDAPWLKETSGPVGLMLAVLDDASQRIERGRRKRRPGILKAAAEAEAWVQSDSREWLFAFASICDVLGLDVEATRARLLAEHGAGVKRTRGTKWRVARGRGRTAVCLARRVSRAA